MVTGLSTRKTALMLVGLGVALVAGWRLVVVLWPGMTNSESEAYYLDLNTGTLFTAPAALTPPVPAPSGPLQDGGGEPAGVRAYLFTCGEDSADDRFIAWVERRVADPTPESPSAIAHPAAQAAASGLETMIAQYDPAAGRVMEWVPADSPAGMEIRSAVLEPCPDGQLPRACVP